MLGAGYVNPLAGAITGGGFIVLNTAYSFNAELEKDKLREEYRRWKTGGEK